MNLQQLMDACPNMTVVLVGDKPAPPKPEPGPWFIEDEEGWPITVSRWNPAGGYEYESMVDENGQLCEFRSRADARDAINKAGGAA